MYESFRFIHAPEFEHKSSDVIDNCYNLDTIRKKFVVYSTKGGYRVYKNADVFLNEFDKMTVENRVFHEMIMSVPQKIKFDIDAKNVDVLNFNPVLNLEDDNYHNNFADTPVAFATLDEKYQHVVQVIINAIKFAFFLSYHVELTDDNIVICESTDPNLNGTLREKYSTHLIINGYYVRNDRYAADLTRQVRGLVPAVYHQFIDMSVNKPIQNFRLANNHKDEDLRIKRIISGHTPKQSMITCIEDCIELNVSPVVQKKIEHVVNSAELTEELNPTDYANVMSLCEADGILQHNTLRYYRKGLFMFNRTSPSWCDICGTEHTRDHSVMVSIRISGTVLTAYKQCRRYLHNHGADGKHFIPIGDVVTDMVIGVNPKTNDNPKISEWTSSKIRRTIELIRNPNTIDAAIKPPRTYDADGNVIMPKVKPKTEVRSMFEQLSADMKRTYNEPTLRPFEHAKTLVVHAAMKMGKTKALVDYINKYFGDSPLLEKKIRIISFRQTFSGNLKEKFPEYILYSDITGPLNQSKLIIQVESLHRLDIQSGDETPDLLVMDECESIFEQFDSGLLRGNFNDCFAKFQYLMRHSKHIVCMDANISDRTFRVLQQMRPGFLLSHPTIKNDNEVTQLNTIYHHCIYKNATEDQYYFTGNKLYWLGVLYAAIEADEKIAIPSSSLIEAKILERNIQKKYPNKHVKLYSSESTNSEKREHFSNVNAHWGELDVLIYTPTVSAGVSFEKAHFDKVFAYFTDQSCPVETCIQMLGRIRNVGTKTLFICINARGNNLPITPEHIRSHAFNRVDNLNRGFDETGLRIEYEANGEKKYHHGDYFTLWVENTRVRNISKNSFIPALMSIIHKGGSQMDELSEEMFEENTGFPPMIDGMLNDELQAIKTAHTEIRGDLKAEDIEKIVLAKDINYEEAEEIRTSIAAQIDISEEKQFEYERFRMRLTYNWQGPLDAAFVTKYSKLQVKRIFKNYCRLSIMGLNLESPIEDKLAHIKTEEQEVNKYLMDNDDFFADLDRKYVYDQHRYAHGLLKVCGWRGVEDPEYRHSVTLALNLRNNEKIYWSNIRAACVEFDMRTPVKKKYTSNNELINNLIGPINKILSIMYGINISVRRNDPDMYFLTKCTLFTRDADTSEKLNIPLLT